ncbi:MAG: DUF6036 family nucleotidyltransferase, partial [Acidobacteriota bacterium]
MTAREKVLIEDRVVGDGQLKHTIAQHPAAAGLCARRIETTRPLSAAAALTQLSKKHYSPAMTRDELLAALDRLGEMLPEKAQIVIAGGAALILGGYIERGTADADVVHSTPPLAQLRSAIRQVAEEKGLSSDWLNDGVKAFGDVLPDDFEDRTDRIGTYGNLRVLLLGRMDLILSKFYAGREVDFEDLAEIQPTNEEIEFVLKQMERVALFRPDKALKMQLYLQQGAGEPTRPGASADQAGMGQEHSREDQKQ